MFQSRRQQTFGNINLGNLSSPPSSDDVLFLQDQATRYRGRFVEISWTMSDTNMNFQLTTKVLPTQPDPSWMLYRSGVDNSELVWGQVSSDLTLIHHLVMLECDRARGSLGKIQLAADAAPRITTSNISTRSSARTNNSQSQQAITSVSSNAQASLQSLPLSDSRFEGHSFPGSDPTSIWLRNLSATGKANHTVSADSASNSIFDSTSAHTQNRTQNHPVSMSAWDQTQHDQAVVDNQPANTTPPTSDQRAASRLEFSVLLLDGSLTNITVPSLLRYITDNGLTGRLSLQGAAGAGEVFIVNGELKHVATLESKGVDALYDLATWVEGEFYFVTGDQTTQLTLAYETTVLLTSCRRMLDYSRFLQKEGLHSCSYLRKLEDILERAAFEQKLLRQGVPADMQQQWRFYQTITGNTTLAEALRASPLTRSESLPILYNLVRCKLIAFSERPPIPQPGLYLEPAEIDQAALDKFLSAAIYATDGLLSRGFFLWLLQQEFFRFERTGCRFALSIFELSSTSCLSGAMLPLPEDALSEAARRILITKRRLDLVGHFDGHYAMLLPETDSAGAAVFANRIIQLLKQPGLTEDLENGSQNIHGSFGIASVPDHVREPGTLIAAARMAKEIRNDRHADRRLWRLKLYCTRG